MKFLFDTHAFLWWHGQRDKLSMRVLKLCEDPENTIYLSLASVWEIQVKHLLGKLTLVRPLKEIIDIEQRENHVELLPITLPQILALYDLPHHHRDPFDRLLIAQARAAELGILSNDALFKDYSIEIIW